MENALSEIINRNLVNGSSLLSKTDKRKQRSPGPFFELPAVHAAAFKKIEDFAG